jgi:hypothetical protein
MHNLSAGTYAPSLTPHRYLFRTVPDGMLAWCCAVAAWLNVIAPYMLAPLFGVPPGTYRLHHVIMHHVEDNKDGWDLSATEGFQRDNLGHFFM